MLVARSRRVLALATLVVAAVVAAAGCGGGGSAQKSIEAPPAPERHPGLLGDGGGAPENSSAGAAESYQPTGEIVADSGFRPWTDGFGFENYGSDVGPQNMVPADVEGIFGSQVCASGTGADCELIPTAMVWMETENERMAGGHCMGFSVAAIKFWLDELDPAD